MSLFELASRKGFRFASARGDLTVEDLWAIPLTAKNGFSLDAVAKTANAELAAARTASESESFVVPTSGLNSEVLSVAEKKMELIRYIIQVRVDEGKAATERANRKAQADLIRDLIEKRKLNELEGASLEELQARLDAIEEAK